MTPAGVAHRTIPTQPVFKVKVALLVAPRAPDEEPPRSPVVDAGARWP